MRGVIGFLADAYFLIIIVRVLLSWISHNPNHVLIKMVYQVTEPPLAKSRQFVPNFGGLDLSPVVLILGVYILEGILIRIF